MLSSKELADRESDARLLAALGLDAPDATEEAESGYGRDGALDAIYDYEDDEFAEKDKDVPSHQQLEVDEDGQPILLRFAYVDEPSCVRLCGL